MISIQLPDGSAQTIICNALHLPVEITGANGAVWRQEWDGNGNRTSVTTPDGARSTFTYDATGQKLYVDGVLVASNSSTATLDYDSHPLVIGGDYDFNQIGVLWSGKIRDVRLWNVARTAAEIQAAMNSTLGGNEAGLAGNWRLDDGSGAFQDHGRHSRSQDRAGRIR